MEVSEFVRCTRAWRRHGSLKWQVMRHKQLIYFCGMIEWLKSNTGAALEA